MIVVTGTKRSGTSMWMQILTASGLPHIGAAFPGIWEDSIKEANPRGFYESAFRKGIYFATNPHPQTGAYIRPEQCRTHVVKVFIPGVIRTELGFLDRVVASLRPWREYSASIQNLYRMEDAHLAKGGPVTVEEAQAKRPKIPPEVEWWFDNYELLRDMVVRRYPVHMCSYPRLLADPETEIRRVLRWLDREEHLAAAIAAVDTGLRTQQDAPYTSEVLNPEQIAVMDEYFDRMHGQLGLSAEFLGRANTLQEQLESRFLTASKPTCSCQTMAMRPEQ